MKGNIDTLSGWLPLFSHLINETTPTPSSLECDGCGFKAKHVLQEVWRITEHQFWHGALFRNSNEGIRFAPQSPSSRLF